jgi:hypothetical protein
MLKAGRERLCSAVLLAVISAFIDVFGSLSVLTRQT